MMLQNVCQRVPEGHTDRSLARSAWEKRLSKEPSRRVRYDQVRRTTRTIEQGAKQIKPSRFSQLKKESGTLPLPLVLTPYSLR